MERVKKKIKKNKNGTLDWIMSWEENTEIEYGRLFFEIIFVQRKIITIS